MTDLDSSAVHLLVSRRAVLGGLDEPMRCQPAAIELRGSEIEACHSLDGLDSEALRQFLKHLFKLLNFLS